MLLEDRDSTSNMIWMIEWKHSVFLFVLHPSIYVGFPTFGICNLSCTSGRKFRISLKQYAPSIKVKEGILDLEKLWPSSLWFAAKTSHAYYPSTTSFSIRCDEKTPHSVPHKGWG